MFVVIYGIKNIRKTSCGLITNSGESAIQFIEEVLHKSIMVRLKNITRDETDDKDKDYPLHVEVRLDGLFGYYRNQII